MTRTARFPFQDATLSVDQRVEDLLSRMTLEDKAGLMFHQMGMVGDLDAPGLFGKPSMRSMLDKRVTHFNTVFVPSAREIAQWNNVVQEAALQHPLGVPVTISTDPRHAFTDNPCRRPDGGTVLAVARAARLRRDRVRRAGGGLRATSPARSTSAVGIRVGAAPADRPGDRAALGPRAQTFGEDAELTVDASARPTSAGSRATSSAPESVSDHDQALPRRRSAEGRRGPALRLRARAGLPAAIASSYHLEPFRGGHRRRRRRR